MEQIVPKLPKEGVGQGKGGGRPREGIREAARQLPVNGATEDARRMHLQRSTEIASITPEAKQAAIAAGIDDNQSKLLEVAKVAPDQQVTKLKVFLK